MEHKKRIEKSVEQNVKVYVTKAVKVFFFVLLALVFAILIGFIVMWLWNWLMPELFGLPTLGYWQAVGLLFLAKIFFGFGSGGPRKGGSSKRRRGHMINKRCKTEDLASMDWRFYDKFWEEEGKEAYQKYVAQSKGDQTGQ